MNRLSKKSNVNDSVLMNVDVRKLNAQKMLVIYASAGNGHESAAKAIIGALLQRTLIVDFPPVDVLNYCTWPIRIAYRYLYRFLVCHLPDIYRFFYFKWEGSDARLVSWIRDNIELKFCGLAQRLITGKQPSIIVSTHFLATGIAALLKRRKRWRGLLWHVVTDFQAHGFQLYPEVDIYVVPTLEVKQTLRNWGVASEKVVKIGIPCNLEFFGVRTDWVAPGKHPYPRVLFNAHGIPFKKVKDLVQGLVFAGGISLVVVGIGSARHRKEIASLIETSDPPCAVFGRVNNLANFFKNADLVVCKAGGLTVSEVLSAGRPMAICYNYPGQEKYNLDFLIKHGAVVQTNTPRDIADLAGDPDRLSAIMEASRRLACPQAAMALAQMLENQENVFIIRN